MVTVRKDGALEFQSGHSSGRVTADGFTGRRTEDGKPSACFRLERSVPTSPLGLAP